MDILFTLGIPTGIVSLIFSVALYLFKREMDNRDKKRDEKEKAEKLKREKKEQNTEKLMLLILQNTRASTVLATATAKAVQRIPDARCNGDMTKALEDAAKMQAKEKDFFMDLGIEHIFEE